MRGILDLKTQNNAGPATGDDLDTIQSPEHFHIIAAIYEAVPIAGNRKRYRKAPI